MLDDILFRFASRRTSRTLLIGAVVAVTAFATPWASLAADPSFEELQEVLRRYDDLMRGESSSAEVVMTVRTERYQRQLRMAVLSEGSERSLVRVLEPAKERGVATLKVEQDVWNYLPKVDRTIKVPSSMMGGSWMGSHFTNDDLVRDARFSEDFACEITSLSGDAGQQSSAVDCRPGEDVAVVWDRVRLVFAGAPGDLLTGDLLVEGVEFYDEDDVLVRTLTYSDPQPVAGRMVPMVLRVVPADAPDEWTEVRYERLEFGVELPASTFRLQSLRR